MYTDFQAEIQARVLELARLKLCLQNCGILAHSVNVDDNARPYSALYKALG